MNGNCPKHLRNASLTACSALVLALAGCGGDENPSNAPRIDGAAATQLSDRADEIADLIDEGRVCDAAHRADELVLATQTEVDKGTVPPAFAAELTSKAEELQNEVNCEPPPEPPPPPAEDGDGEGDGDD